jgi:hypothetical protein
MPSKRLIYLLNAVFQSAGVSMLEEEFLYFTNGMA